jgi:hypothetical protein
MIGVKSRLNEKAAAPSETNFNRAISMPAGACFFAAAAHLNKRSNSPLTYAPLPGVNLRWRHTTFPAKASYALSALLLFLDQSKPLRFRFPTTHSHTRSFTPNHKAGKMRLTHRSRFRFSSCGFLYVRFRARINTFLSTITR